MHRHSPSPTGPPDEIADLLESCQGPLYGFLRGIVGDSEEARDLVRDVFERAWSYARRGVAPFDAQRQDAERRRWLFHVAYTRAVSFRSRQRVIRWERLGDSLEAADLFDDSLEQRVIEQEALQAALSMLRASDAALILLIVVHQFTAAEAGAILGVPGATAAKRFARAKEKLRANYLAQQPSTMERSA